MDRDGTQVGYDLEVNVIIHVPIRYSGGVGEPRSDGQIEATSSINISLWKHHEKLKSIYCVSVRFNMLEHIRKSLLERNYCWILYRLSKEKVLEEMFTAVEKNKQIHKYLTFYHLIIDLEMLKLVM